jgi:hypothetical protein
MAWVIYANKGSEYFIVVNEERKKSILDSEIKNVLIDWYDNVIYTYSDDYFIIENNRKQALYHPKKGFISAWLDYPIDFATYSYCFSELIKMGVLIVSEHDYKSSPTKPKQAFFKLDGTQITDWFDYISIEEITEDDIYYYARSGLEEGFVFSLKTGKLIDYLSYGNKNEDYLTSSKNKFFVVKDNNKYRIVNKNNETIVTAEYISPILKRKKDNEENVYIVIFNKRKKALFYDGYLTKTYDFIFPVSPDLIFLAYRFERKIKKVYLLDLKNKTSSKILFPIFSRDKSTFTVKLYAYANFHEIEKHFELPDYFYKKMEKLCDYTGVVVHEIYCPNCKNIWWFYIGQNIDVCFCPLCEANKLEAFIL